MEQSIQSENWDSISRFYDDEYDYDYDVTFFQSLAAPKNSILELGCGTGRCLLPFVQSGHATTGVDFSSDMLQRIEVRLKDEPAAIRKLTHLIEADITDVSLNQTFDLVVIACNTLLLFEDYRDQERVLQTAFAHTKPGGICAVGVSNPDLHRLAEKFPLVKHAGSWVDSATGRTVDCFEYNYYDEANQLLVGVKMYDEIGEDRVVYRTRHNYELRYMFPRELQAVMERCGFRIRKIYGDYACNPHSIDSADIVMVAERPAE